MILWVSACSLAVFQEGWSHLWQSFTLLLVNHLTHWPLEDFVVIFKIPDSTKPLADPMLTCNQQGPPGKCLLEYSKYQSHTVFEIYTFKITATSPGGQWVKMYSMASNQQWVNTATKWPAAKQTPIHSYTNVEKKIIIHTLLQSQSSTPCYCIFFIITIIIIIIIYFIFLTTSHVEFIQKI